MSTFDVKVRRVTVAPHPNADRLELGQVDDYRVVIMKEQFQTGDLAVYIPEQAIVPLLLQETMGLVGKLAGPEQNRVKAIRLRGELSQGLLYHPDVWPDAWIEGTDVAEDLGIKKWVPPVPIEMSGQVEPAPGGFFRTFTDIENVRRYPTVIQDGETVIMTEKLHGTCFIAGVLNGQRVVSSKGIAERHLVLVENSKNVYWRGAELTNIFSKLERFMKDLHLDNALVFGEIIGVQDLKYGLKAGEIDVRFFDLYINGHYVDGDQFFNLCTTYNIKPVPVLYAGPFSKEKMLECTTGQSMIADHMREGTVVRLLKERTDLAMGRVILKSVSTEYLTRKNGTEFE